MNVDELKLRLDEIDRRAAYMQGANRSALTHALKLRALIDDLLLDLLGSPDPTPSVTPSLSPSKTPQVTPTPSVTPSNTVSVSPSTTPSYSPSRSPSKTPSASQTPSTTPSQTSSSTPSPSSSPSTTPSISASPSVSLSATPSKTPSTTPSNSLSASPSVTPSSTPSNTPPAPSTTPSSTPPSTPPISPSSGEQDLPIWAQGSYPEDPDNWTPSKPPPEEVPHWWQEMIHGPMMTDEYRLEVYLDGKLVPYVMNYHIPNGTIKTMCGLARFADGTVGGFAKEGHEHYPGAHSDGPNLCVIRKKGTVTARWVPRWPNPW